MERPQLKKKKMKKRCAIPEKKLKELESILDQAIALPFPHINEEEEDGYETESRHRRVLLLCNEIDQRSFFLHSLLIAEISSSPSPPREEGHLINIQRCLDALHRAYHEWTENFDPSLVQQYLGSDRPQPECTASCFNTDDEEEEEEDEDIGELAESIVSTQMSENPMELECCDDVVAGAVVPAAEMVSVGVQTDSLLLLQDEEESDDEEEKMKSSDCFREVTETEDEWEEEAEAEEEEEAEKEVMLVRASAAKAGASAAKAGASAVVAKGVVWMGCGMMMMMIGRFYYANFFNSSSNRCCFDYYYRFSRVSGGLLPT